MPDFDPFSNFLGPESKAQIAEREAPYGIIKGPGTLGEAYGKIAEHGIYGPEGVGSIMSKIRASRNFQRRALSRSLRRRFAGRLGPRSGATETLAANITYGGAAGEDAATLANLQSENLKSKLAGIEGLGDVLELLERREQLRLARKAQKPGVLDYLGAGAGIASSAVDIFSGGTTAVAKQVAKQV